ncbi:Mut7-C RNAse domain-containing protein [Motiliproteus sp.]|uniref:Mut7-C RNAse domain-containing protein n=1 Tax=Motiliproteus sp. TaxID=1898955 RepID=UPI003BAD8C87
MPNSHAPLRHHCQFRFYSGLNDFLPAEKKHRTLAFRFSGTPGLRDSIQAQRVPHVEVAFVLVNGQPQPAEYQLQPGDRIAVYPRFQRLIPESSKQWHPALPKPLRFILDVHLGKLCRHLRLLGFDTRWGNDYEDPFIIDTAVSEQRIVLTRDLGILKQARLPWGYFVRATDPTRQITEVADYFTLNEAWLPLSRCINCNGELDRVRKNDILEQLPPGTRRSYDKFYQCHDCRSCSGAALTISA